MNVVNTLISANYGVYAKDYREYGKSEGLRGILIVLTIFSKMNNVLQK